MLYSLLLCSLGLTTSIHAQVTVTTGVTAATLAGKLVGPGIVVMSPTLTCPSTGYGTFSGSSSLSFDSGIVLTNGLAKTITGGYGAFGPASNFASTNTFTSGDAQLTALCGYTTYDACILEFDFRPAGDTVRFQYVFGSEEYGCCICSSVNDVFGFFISGPGFSTPYNMARVPGTSIPVCINSVNCSSGSLCTSMGTGSPFCSYYINNSSGASITYYGMTTTMTAMAVVAPCDTYHLKLGIADATDHILDSGVFLKAGSLTSTGTHITPIGLNSADTTYGSQYCVRGCAPGKFVFSRPAAASTPLTLHFYIGGTAVNGYDYNLIADSVIIPAYAATDTLLIVPTSVMPAGPKNIKLLLSGSFTYYCGGSSGAIDSAKLTIYDSLGPITGVNHICPGSNTALTDPLGSGTWSSSIPGIATAGSTTGIVTGVASGISIITYGFPGSCITTAPVTVNPNPSVITGIAAVCTGASTTLTDSIGGGVWSSGSPSIATAGSLTGIITGVLSGTVTITYTLPTGCTARKTVTVNTAPGPISGVPTTCIGNTTTLSDAGGGSWSSGTPGVATIGSTGIVTGVTAGYSVITYSVGAGCNAFITVNVFPVPGLITGLSHVCTGLTTPLSDGVAGGYWTSGATGIATIGSASGIVTGVASGTTTITYAVAPASGCSTIMTFAVDPSPPAIAGLTNLCVGQSTTLTSGGSGAWSSSSPSIASIGSGSGIVTGISAGTATITFMTPAGCVATFVLTVGAAPTPISGPTNICMGSTTTLSDATGGGSWSSTDPTIAYIDAGTGAVAPVSTGLTMISYTLPSGCFATVIVTVNPNPGTITGLAAVCTGAATTLFDGISGGVWISSSSAIAGAGTLSGVITGVAAGTATISYVLPSGCMATTVVTVNPLPSTILGPSNVCVGLSISMTDGTPGGTWSASNTNVTIGSTTGTVVGVSGGTSVITYTLPTGCYITKTVTVNSSAGPISGTLAICPSTTSTLTDITPGGTWTSSSTGVATIGSSSGVVGGIAPGTTTITYSIGSGCTTTAVVTVNPLPPVIGGTPVVCEGSSTVLTDAVFGGTWGTGSSLATVGSTTGLVSGVSAGVAIITYTIGTGCMRTIAVTINPLPSPISGPSAVCIGAIITETDPGGGTWISGTPAVATIGASSGVVTGLAVGTTIITYTLPATTIPGCSITKTVTVSLSPVPISGLANVCVDASTPLTDGVPGGTWGSSSANATVGSGSGIVTGISAGTTVITYSLGTGCIVTRPMTINPAPAGITGSMSLCVGATVMLSDITAGGTWSSGTTSIATIGATSGIVSGIAPGTPAITYTSSAGCTAVAIITVNATPGAITGPATVCIGATMADIVLPAGGVWSTSATTITIAPVTGIVTGVSAGTALITYSLGTCRATRTISINPITPITGTTGLCIGATATLSDGVTGGTWTSSTPALATIGSLTGIVTAVSAGTTTITYTLPSGCTATKTVTVNAGPLPIGGTTHVCIGGSTTLTDGAGGGTWGSSNPAIAGIGSTTGLVTGVATGVATITYSLGTGCTITTPVTVNPNPSGITGVAMVCIGATTTLADISTGGSWSSSSLPTATVVATTGVVTGVAAGNATITYTLTTGCIATRPITVNPVPTAIAGTASVCAGATTTLSDLVTGGTWSSGSANATIGSSTGVVTGVTAGTATITYSIGATSSLCYVTRVVTVYPLPAPITGSASVCIGSTTFLSDAVTGGVWVCTSPVISIGSASGVVTGIAVGTATVTYTPGGCSITRVVTVNPLPATITGSPNLCVGNSTTLAETTAGGSWSSSNTVIAVVGSGTGIVTGVNPGTASIIYTSAAGCATAMTVTVSPAPPGISGSSVVCVGQNILLTDPSTGGRWTSSNTSIATVGSASGVVGGVAGGSVLVTYTATTGCYALMTISVNAVPPFTGLANMCAWGDTLTLHDINLTGTYSSTLATVLNLGSGAGRLTSNAPGTATVTYTLPTGCLLTVTFTVNPLPMAMTGIMHVCAGATTALHEATAGGVWSSTPTTIATVGSTGIVSGVAGGIALVRYTLSTGCKIDTPITVYPQPAPITVLSTTILAGTSTTFTDATPGGVWSSSNVTIATAGAGTGIIHGVTPGVVTITYTAASGCATTRTVTVTALSGVHPGEGNIGIYPNPNRGAFSIRGTYGQQTSVMDFNVEANDALSVEVTDMVGRVVFKNKIQIQNGQVDERIDLGANAATGMYLVTLRSGKEVRVFHVMVER